MYEVQWTDRMLGTSFAPLLNDSTAEFFGDVVEITEQPPSTTVAPSRQPHFSGPSTSEFYSISQSNAPLPSRQPHFSASSSSSSLIHTIEEPQTHSPKATFDSRETP